MNFKITSFVLIYNVVTFTETTKGTWVQVHDQSHGIQGC